MGEGGTILRTDDGGLSWTAQFGGTTASLGAVSVVDADTAIAVGEAGTILRTDDGGITWIPQQSGTTLILNGVSFVDANAGTAVGEAGTILRTDDGGATWIPQFGGTLNTLINVTFVDANTGWVVVENVLFVLRTTDGGEHWTPQHIDRSAQAVSFADPNMGTVVGGVGFLARTTDGGITWGPYPPAPPPNDAVVDTCLVDANTGWAVTNALDLILRTTDGGMHWTRQRTGWFNATFRRIACVDGLIATAVGSDGLGIIVRTTDGGEHWMRQGIGVTGVVLNGVSFWGPDIGTVTGVEAGIIHTTDGGATWTPLGFPPGRGPFDDVYQGGPNQIVVTAVFADRANDDHALRTDDGGATWTFTQFGLCPIPTYCYFLNRISFLSADEWWIAGRWAGRPPQYGSVHHTMNGGATLSASQLPGFTVNEVSFSSTSTGTAVGSFFYGPIMRTTDRGDHWMQQSSPQVELKAVSFIDDNIGIAAGVHETIVRTTTGGE